MAPETTALLLLLLLALSTPACLLLPAVQSCDVACNPDPRPPVRSHRPPRTEKRPAPHSKPYNPPALPPPAPPADYPPPATTLPPPPPSAEKCSVDALKLGLCLDVLGGLVHTGLGDPFSDACCPLLQGLVELEAAAWLCTAIKLKVLNHDIYIPLALNVLITCGKDPPPGYICPA